MAYGLLNGAELLSEKTAMARKSEVINRRSIDLSPFASAKRQLEADSRAWVETSYLLAEIKRNAREPIPQSILEHLSERLDGTAKKRQGRGRRTPSRDLTNWLIAASFERRESWLIWRQAMGGLNGWPRIQNADWWQGPPSERAARMVKERFGLNLGWERVRNIAYEARKTARKKA